MVLVLRYRIIVPWLVVLNSSLVKSLRSLLCHFGPWIHCMSCMHNDGSSVGSSLVVSWFVLSSLVVSWFVLSSLVVSWFVLSSLVVSWFVLSSLVVSWFVLSSLVVSWFVFSSLVASWFVFSSLTSFRQFLLRGGLSTVFQEATDVCRQKIKHDFDTFWPRSLLIIARAALRIKRSVLFCQETHCERL